MGKNKKIMPFDPRKFEMKTKNTKLELYLD